jgi:hypothetical protein
VTLAALGLSGCGEATDTLPLRLSTHALSACAPPGEARLRLTALGDFAGSETTSEDLPLARSSDLVVPPETRAFEASVESGLGRFIGYAERGPDGVASVLLWPERQVCPIEGPRAYPVTGGGQALGYDPASQALLLAGGSARDQPSASVGALGFDTGTGAVTDEGEDAAALREPRAFATVTAFGDRLLVAGGENPLHGEGDAAEPRKTAELYDPRRRSFDAESIALVEPRSQHAAVALANGSTLLVGGRGAIGDALRVLELVNPDRRSASIAGLAALLAPRIAPSAFALDDGRVFVGGGSAADGTPLSVLEWLSADGRAHLGAVFPPEMPARYDRAFVAMPGGGVLAVGGCEARAPRDDAEAEACAEACRSGCPPRPGYDAWWITRDGEPRALEFDLAAPRPLLLGGEGGTPILATGAPGERRLYRFDPWHARFDALPVTVPAPPRAGLPAASVDVEALVWLAETAEGVLLEGLRVGTRNRFARDVLLVTQADPEFPDRPLHLAPDRGLDELAGYDGALWFTEGAAARVYVAATDYADVSLEIDFEGEPPRVWLGQSELGGTLCPFPSGESPIWVIRSGSTARLRAGAATTQCDVAAGRLNVAFAAPLRGDTRIRSVDLERRVP